MDKYNLGDIIGEPDFSVKPEKYIERCSKLITDIDDYIEKVRDEIKEEVNPIANFGNTLNLIMAEYHKEVAIKIREGLKYSSR